MSLFIFIDRTLSEITILIWKICQTNILKKTFIKLNMNSQQHIYNILPVNLCLFIENIV